MSARKPIKIQDKKENIEGEMLSGKPLVYSWWENIESNAYMETGGFT